MNDSENRGSFGQPPKDPVDAAVWAWRSFFAYILNPQNSTAITAIATCVLVGVTVAYTIYSGLQWKATRESNEVAWSAAVTAAKQLEMSERPWLDVRDLKIVGPLTIKEEGARLSLQFVPRNSGHSPAILVNPEVKLLPRYMLFPDPRQQRKDVCDATVASSQLPHNRYFLETWLPGDLPSRQFSILASKDDIEKAMQARFKWNPPAPQHFELIIVICVAYRAAFTITQYHTAYVLDVERTVSSPPFINEVFQNEPTTIPPQQLRLVYDEIAGKGPEAN